VCRPFDSEDQGESSRPHFQPDADPSGIIFDEVNAEGRTRSTRSAERGST
jgi:hypothetical protein